ncbi:hypothetical protein [Chlamydia sp. 17-3921]|uniref:hypothetical protein n=1 Tax=Chlamydia sp. 17-3921 TaxID=2675798 RepID=UPI00191A3B00|nr:hypothetical protein [Chlamydia sp. 17-3921]
MSINSNPHSQIETSLVNTNVLGQMIRESQMSPKAISISFLVLGILLLLAGVLLLTLPGVVPAIAMSLGTISIGIGAALLAISISIYIFKRRQPIKQIIDLTEQLLDTRKILTNKDAELKRLHEQVITENANLNEELNDLKEEIEKLRQEETSLRNRLKTAQSAQELEIKERIRVQEEQVCFKNELGQKVTKLEASLKEQKAEKKYLESKLVELSSVKETLLSRLALLTELNADLTIDVGKYTKNNRDLQSKLEDQKLLNIELKNSLDELANTEETNKALSKTIEQQKILIDGLRENLNKLTTTGGAGATPTQQETTLKGALGAAWSRIKEKRKDKEDQEDPNK